MAPYTDGQSFGRPRTHGMARTPIYNLWGKMLSRCRNPEDKSYPRYGGRGIEVCERWLSFEKFYADMGDKPSGRSIDRINNEGNYEPGNCRWATDAQQRANKRRQRKLERICSEPGCARDYKAKDLCAMHYLQHHRASRRP